MTSDMVQHTCVTARYVKVPVVLIELLQPSQSIINNTVLFPFPNFLYFYIFLRISLVRQQVDSN